MINYPFASEFEGFDPSLLNISSDDTTSRKFLMLIEAHQGLGAMKAAQKYGYSIERFYQLQRAFRQKGFEALMNRKPGPKKKSVRTESFTNHVIRHKFLDDKQSAAIIAQKLHQQGMKASERSVQRVIEEFGLQKKAL